ncbi:transcriptional regulator [Endozoicomonas sp. (ex Bugula neritina AB1)]|nr:transcriptional regulator [Endozoicomonas sp. (ex Bugula neritina AB1)]
MQSKRDLLVSTALQLFYEKGINSVGINEVLKVSGIAKKTLYNYFSSKDDLVLATLEARDELFMQWLEKELASATTDEDVIRSLFGALDRWFKDEVDELPPFRGCYFINSSLESSVSNPAVGEYCAQHKQQVRRLIQSKLQSENEKLLDLLCVLKEGAIVSAYVSHDIEIAGKCIPLAMKWLD